MRGRGSKHSPAEPVVPALIKVRAQIGPSGKRARLALVLIGLGLVSRMLTEGLARKRGRPGGRPKSREETPKEGCNTDTQRSMLHCTIRRGLNRFAHA